MTPENRKRRNHSQPIWKVGKPRNQTKPEQYDSSLSNIDPNNLFKMFDNPILRSLK